jgi:transposase-like protein
MTQSDPRRKLKAVRSRYQQAEKDRRAAAIEAAAQGVPVTHVADALGVNRVTVHRWIHDSKERPGAVRAARGTTHEEITRAQDTG